ncbi:MAG TPA: 2Fe-2S iron-sulfur cluster-binding protein [Dehalococcoidales bacterium]
MSKITITINDKEVPAESSQTVLEVALANGIYIPHLCHHPELTPRGVCRLCLVETSGGELITACRMPVFAGMVVKTKTEKVDKAIRPTVELLIAYHHDTCRGCSAIGKCELQTVMSHLKIDRKRVRRLHPPPAKKPLDKMSPSFNYDPNHCVLCGVCIHTCEDIHNTSLLYYIGRGHETKVAFYGDEKKCKSCLKCVARCPVGALMLKNTGKLKD